MTIIIQDTIDEPTNYEVHLVNTEEVSIVTKITDESNCPDLFDFKFSYTITNLDEYRIMVKCSACNHRNKTTKPVRIVEDETGNCFLIGKDCLYKYFDVSKEDLKNANLKINSFLKVWHSFLKNPTLMNKN